MFRQPTNLHLDSPRTSLLVGDKKLLIKVSPISQFARQYGAYKLHTRFDDIVESALVFFSGVIFGHILINVAEHGLLIPKRLRQQMICPTMTFPKRIDISCCKAPYLASNQRFPGFNPVSIFTRVVVRRAQ